MRKLRNVIFLLVPEKEYGATLLQSAGLNSLGQVSFLLELHLCPDQDFLFYDLEVKNCVWHVVQNELVLNSKAEFIFYQIF